MWVIKVLNGNQQGQMFPLKKGNNILGRSSSADVKVADHGASKAHAKLYVTQDKVIISDLESSNGTFVNGILIQNHGLRSGDKILVNKTILSVFQMPDNVVFHNAKKNSDSSLKGTNKQSAPMANLHVPASQAISTTGNTAPQLHNAEQSMALYNESSANDLAPFENAQLDNQNNALAAQESLSEPQGIQGVVKKADDYIDNVALPPIYKATEKFDFKMIILSLIVILVATVTFLAIMPLSRLASESVLTESKRRALTIARNLARLNRNALQENSEIALSTDFVKYEDGVSSALIVKADNGAILAPLHLAGSFVKDPLVLSVRKTNKEIINYDGEGSIAASVPVKFYDPLQGEATVKAYAIIVYKMDSTAIDFNRILSLFIQVFLIAMIVAGVIFGVIYKVIIYPIRNLNKEIDTSLREGTSDITIAVKLPLFQDLVSNINSALSRAQKSSMDDDFGSMVDKGVEANEIAGMFPIPAFTIDPDSLRFSSLNEHVLGHPLFNDDVSIDFHIEEFTDQSLYESLNDLIQSANSNPNVKHSNQIPTTDHELYEITAKAIIDGSGVSYFLFTVMEVLSEESFEE